MVIHPSSWYMQIKISLNREDYHLIGLPFDNINDAKQFAQQRMKEYPVGKQKIIKSTKQPYFYGVYELISYKQVREFEKRINDKQKRSK